MSHNIDWATSIRLVKSEVFSVTLGPNSNIAANIKDYIEFPEGFTLVNWFVQVSGSGTTSDINSKNMALSNDFNTYAFGLYNRGTVTRTPNCVIYALFIKL